MPPHLKLCFTVAVFALSLLTNAIPSFASITTLTEKDLTRAEKILIKLRELGEAAPVLTRNKKTIEKYYPELYINVSSLRDSDLKTDLATAIYLYEKALLLHRSEDIAVADCEEEVRDSYRKICLEKGGLSRSDLLLAKACLHADWAAALVRYSRGARDFPTLVAFSEVKHERAIDVVLSERFVSILQSLERDVASYSSLGEFEAHRRIASISFDQLSDNFKTAAVNSSPILASLPRNSLTYHLQSALNSYADGLFWWQKTYKRKEMVVSVNNWTEPPPRSPLGFDAGTIDYAVVSIWRKAGRHIASAKTEIERAKNADPESSALARNLRLQ